MKNLIKVMFFLALIFASTFVFFNLTGLLTLEKIQAWLTSLQNMPAYVVGNIVILLLFADLFIAMPTLTIMILSGFFIGPFYGAAFSITGLTLAGFSGYYLSKRYGDSIIAIVLKKEEDRHNAKEAFRKYGVATILLSRAVPILPEVSACMAGMNNMPRKTFITAWMFSIVPYACIAAYAGSISTASNPQPAIFTGIGLTLGLWIAWFIFRKYKMIE